MNLARGVIGIVCLLAIAWVSSENRRAIRFRVVGAALALQWALALLLLKAPPASAAVSLLARGVGALDKATQSGTSFVFGYLGGAPSPFAESGKGSTLILAFDVFPLVLVICALSSLLFHWGVLQRIVAATSFVLRRTVGVGGALGTGAAVNVFVGMVEAPLLVRPYLDRMSRGELFALMSCGLAGIAGTVMGIYGRILDPVIPDSFSNVIAASLISAPAAIAIAAIMIPFESNADEEAALHIADPPANALEAVARGAGDGVVILANILAFLIVVLAFVALIDMALGLGPDVAGAPLSLQRLFAWIYRPIAFVIGVDRGDLDAAARLLATKTVVNEFVAYMDFAALPPDALTPRSRLILTYAMCGFANFGSVGIQVGGLCAMAPARRKEVSELGFKAMLAGVLATLMSGALVGAIS